MLFRSHYDTEKAQEFFEIFAKYREDNGLHEFEFNEKLTNYTQTRAAELAYFFDHKRPAGTKASYAENIAQIPVNLSDRYGVQDVFDSFVASAGHKENLDAPRAYYRTNVACFMARRYIRENGYVVNRYVYEQNWIQIFR